jgi:signal transduction histidine kinase
MMFARPPQLTVETVDLVELVETVFGELKQDADGQQSELLRNDDHPQLMINADKAQLSATVKALVINSLEALGHGGWVRLELKELAGDGCGDVQLVVSDNGPGIPPETREHIFDPFYSGREAGRGLGFGLSKAWRCVTDHGGRIEVGGRPGQGAEFVITLPVTPRQDEARSEPAREDEVPAERSR